MKVIGLTGGIGAGKSTVSKLFEEMGIPVYYADDEAKKIMTENETVKKQIIELLGDAAYEGNKLNTRYISGIVFDNPTMLQKLEEIVHPQVRKDFGQWVKKQNADYVMVENAILHKSGMDQLVDYIIWITAPEEIRLKRLQQRDKKNKGELKKIMQNQIEEKKLLKNNFFVINNSGDLHKLKEIVAEADKKVKKLLNKS